jgi:Na+-transporting methylmalonyl-CoA/oxaloacetate decarboxylase beta subunit
MRSWCLRSSPAYPAQFAVPGGVAAAVVVVRGRGYRESDLPNFYELFSNTVLYGSTFFLGLLLGVLCEANTILNPVVLKLLVLGFWRC